MTNEPRIWFPDIDDSQDFAKTFGNCAGEVKKVCDRPHKPTGYDQTIEGIIKTLDWIPDDN